MTKKEFIVIVSIVLLFTIGSIQGLKWSKENSQQWLLVDEVRS